MRFPTRIGYLQKSSSHDAACRAVAAIVAESEIRHGDRKRSKKLFWFRRFAVVLLVGAVCVAGDFYTKYWAVTHLVRGRPRQLIPGLLEFSLVTNKGMCGGLLQGAGALPGLIRLFGLAGTIAFAGWRLRSRNAPGDAERVGLGLWLGGGTANTLERLARGEVIDFIALRTAIFEFTVVGTFNLADVFIGVGGVIFIASAWRLLVGFPPARVRESTKPG